jgi:acyl-coenzyme A thioesterase PaaI-like protein
LLDTASMVAAWSDDTVPESLAGATVSMSVDFVAAARGVELTATGRAVRRGRSLCFCEVEVTEPGGGVIAKGLAVHRFG